MKGENHDDQGGSIRAIDRAIGILGLVGEKGEVSLREVARGTELSEPTVFRYLAALVGHGWLVHQADGRYSLGIPLFQLGHRAVADLDVRKLARRPMETLLVEYGETVNLAVRQGDVIVVIDCLESPSPLRRGASIGEQDLWFSSALGKAILAHLPEQEVLRLHGELDVRALTEHTLTSLPALIADLGSTRARGYSIDNEESEVGLSCVAAAIHNRHGDPRYAISVSGPIDRVRSALEQGLGERVASEARSVSERLGHKAEMAQLSPRTSHRATP